ncbi:MAG: retropepsin-like aspartic protease [Candidatus Omnitrophica bacterium]|nr:retropepsin-like aspartic protease [Candidatus Omnitrophota bacterium]MDD5042187.1 retropepsin-like aspartic protease [Candidatus Omnitrophota bacterium]MDD5500216.1 retropepsin-like aspartic protease [Candidatus Omnitrophota bacterium]
MNWGNPATRQFYRYILTSACAAFLIAATDCAALADVIYLKNGRSIEGLVKKESAEEVELEIIFGSMKFSRMQIDHISRSSGQEAEAIRKEWDSEKKKARERDRKEELERESEPKKVNVDRRSGHVRVMTTLNNRVKADLILDTGASLVLLSKRIAGMLGLAPGGRNTTPVELIMADGRKTSASMVVLDSVKVEGVEARNVEAVILAEKDSASMPEDGLLGMSFLKKFNFKIDQKNDKLILEKL